MRRDIADVDEHGGARHRRDRLGARHSAVNDDAVTGHQPGAIVQIAVEMQAELGAPAMQRGEEPQQRVRVAQRAVERADIDEVVVRSFTEGAALRRTGQREEGRRR